MRTKIIEGCLRLYSAYQISKHDFGTILRNIREKEDLRILHVFSTRSICSMEFEWAASNFLYKVTKKDEYKNCDITAEKRHQFLGVIAWLFIS